MEKNTKIAIGLGIVAVLVWYSQKAKPTETTTEEPSSGGGGGGGAFPSAPLPTPTPTPTPPATTTKPTTPSNVSNALKNATVITQAGTKPNIPNPTGGVTSSTSASQYSAVTRTINCANGKTYNPLASDVTAAGGVANWCNKNGHGQVGGGIGNAPNIPFDGKTIRPAFKVDFF
jgi:hypothetical protein